MSELWEDLAARGEAIRVQVHTHPGAAYHSHTDDAFPIIAIPLPQPGHPQFLPQGAIGFDCAFLARMGDDYRFSEVTIADQLEVLP